MSDPQQPRAGAGRPRTRPRGIKFRGVPLTDEEFAAVRGKADRAGVTLAEWMRRAVLRAAGVKAAQA